MFAKPTFKQLRQMVMCFVTCELKDTRDVGSLHVVVCCQSLQITLPGGEFSTHVNIS